MHHADHLCGILLGTVKVTDLIGREFNCGSQSYRAAGLLPLLDQWLIAGSYKRPTGLSLDSERSILVD